LILVGERSGLQTHTATTESVSLVQQLAFWIDCKLATAVVEENPDPIKTPPQEYRYAI
jgi:hypothetical protein